MVFEVYDENNNFIEEIVTDENGIALTSKLEKGKYKVKEILTNEWYYLDNKIYTAEIKKDGDIAQLKIENEAKNPEIYIEKVGVDKAEIGSQIEYDISVQNRGNTSLDNFTLTDVLPTEYEIYYGNKISDGNI